MKVVDSEGREIKIGSNVEVPSPDDNYGDIYNNEFVGRVVDIGDDPDYPLISVKDQEDNVFDIEAERVEVIE